MLLYRSTFWTVFETDGKVFLCKLCSVKVNPEKNSQITQHKQISKHRESQAKTKAPKQPALTACSTDQQFNKQLWQMLLAADIPFSKVNCLEFRQFFSKFCKWYIPDETHFPVLFEEKLAEVWSNFVGKYVWVALDETRDVCSRCVVHVVAGPLDESKKVRFNVFVLFCILYHITWLSVIYSYSETQERMLHFSD